MAEGKGTRPIFAGTAAQVAERELTRSVQGVTVRSGVRVTEACNSGYPITRAERGARYVVRDFGCPVYDFVTRTRCALETGHPPFHKLPDGEAFGIGFTMDDAREWGGASRG